MEKKAAFISQTEIQVDLQKAVGEGLQVGKQ